MASGELLTNDMDNKRSAVMGDAVKRKICHDDLFDRFKAVAQGWLEEIPEARTLFLVVDWVTGKNDFPAVHVVTAEELTEQAVLDSMGQALKLLNALAELHNRQVAAANSTLRQAQAIIQQMQQSSPSQSSSSS